ncbi:proline-rich transmembrane protein 1-like isoform X1 [Stegostoma tigrinum]|uniref:proline-rich transmembrane protein 1-like isoform X1 n=2 Tax=Stegostoma tigrinum TaxID=3053191 RepID=UPI00202B1D84|nr:proline-rich transmembrane protein 1-like isoform X1 [Stegostoma tigrinum]
MATEKAVSGSSDAPTQHSSPPPYNQVIETRHNATSTGYSMPAQLPPLPMGMRGYIQETQFHSRAPGYTAVMPHGPMGPGTYISPPGYAVQLQPYTTLVPVYPIGNYPAPYLPGYTGITPGTQQSQMPSGFRILEPQRPPHDYLPIAVLTTVCCFWPTGIIAIIKALETRAAVTRGDRLSAEIASRQARNYSFVSLAVGIAAMVLCAILVLVVVIEAKHHDTEWDP